MLLVGPVLEMEWTALPSALKAALGTIRVVRLVIKSRVLVVGKLMVSSTMEALWTAVIARLVRMVLFVVIVKESILLSTSAWMPRTLVVLLQPCRVRLIESRVSVRPPLILETLTAQRTLFPLTSLFSLKLVASIALAMRDPMAQELVVPTALSLLQMPMTLWCFSPLRAQVRLVDVSWSSCGMTIVISIVVVVIIVT